MDSQPCYFGYYSSELSGYPYSNWVLGLENGLGLEVDKATYICYNNTDMVGKDSAE
jgi:hypothetical protein